MDHINMEMDVAVIGMAGRFPGAETVEAFWDNIRSGREGLTHFTKEQLQDAGIGDETLNNLSYVKTRGVIKDPEAFDAFLFEYSPHEAELIDPQQRLFLETVWQALENGGYNPYSYPGLIGLFGGMSMNTYLYRYLLQKKGRVGTAEGYQLAIGNDKDFLTTRVSYKLNLRGPSLNMQTACSTSLVAIHMACQNLLNFSCDMALAGGVSATLPQEQGYMYQEGMILSADGHCRPFDAGAGGTVSGNGVGVVLLKRIEDAIEDGDNILAVVKASAINNDGSQRVGYTAPSVDGQADVIATAQALSDINPEDFGYIEAHGTGTEMGDPIEIAALTQIFREKTEKKQYCAIGSVKSNIGHLDAAAGVAGFIKTVCALQAKELPPSLHFEKPNPALKLEESPFYINSRLQDWPGGESPRRAAVSSFGIGGTNAHVVLQEAPQEKTRDAANGPFLLQISAKTGSALDSMSKALGSYFRQNECDMRDAAFTLSIGRKNFPQRRIAVVNNRDEAGQVLSELNPKKILNGSHSNEPSPPPVAFMFSGQGSQYINMGYHLYHKEPVFKEAVDNCCKILKPLLDADLFEIIYPMPGREQAAKEKINQTRYTQPALFTVEYALACLLESYGIKPSAMVGHSIGEYVCAHLDGVFSLEDALRVVAERGKLMQAMPGGKMLSVDLDQHQVSDYISGDIALAAVNSRNSCVLSGPEEAIDTLQKELEEKGIGCRKLHTSHAFHSAMMEEAAKQFEAFLKNITMNAPQNGWLSNVTGNPVTDEEATSAAYYARHLRNTVRFNDNLSALLQQDNALLLEVGPGKTLSSLAKRHVDAGMGRSIINTLRHPQEQSNDYDFWLQSLGLLWLSAVDVGFEKHYRQKQARRIPLPGYAFEKQRYSLATTGADTTHFSSLPERSNNPVHWLYEAMWKQVAAKGNPSALTELHVFDLSGRLSGQLKENCKIYYNLGANGKHGDKEFYKELVQDSGHCLFVASPDLGAGENYRALLALLQSVKEHEDVVLYLLTCNLYSVNGTEKTSSAAAALPGLLRVAELEIPSLKIKHIDVESLQDEGILNTLFLDDNHLLAVRRERYWTRRYETAVVAETDWPPEKPVIVISGGSGNLASLMVETLSQKGAADFVLISRSLFPAPESWKEAKEKDESLRVKIGRFEKALEAGNTLRFFDADVADEPAMRSVLDSVRDSFGRIDWFIHAAGQVGNAVFQPLEQISEEDIKLQFRAKVDAVQLLAKLDESYGFKRVILQSSLSTVLGGLGFGHYAAANSFMDHFAAETSARPHWKSIAWDGWHFGGRPAEAQFGITPDEAPALLSRVFSAHAPGLLVVSSAPLHERIQNNRAQLQAAQPSEADSLYQRPNLATPYAAPETDLHKEVLAVWQSLLGIGEIGIHDDFFDLGGNSLMGTQLISRLRDTFKVDLPMRALFEDPTIAGVSTLIEKGRGGDGDDEMSRMLKELEEMDSSDVKDILDKRKKEGDNPQE